MNRLHILGGALLFAVLGTGFAYTPKELVEDRVGHLPGPKLADPTEGIAVRKTLVSDIA